MPVIHSGVPVDHALALRKPEPRPQSHRAHVLSAEGLPQDRNRYETRRLASAISLWL